MTRFGWSVISVLVTAACVWAEPMTTAGKVDAVTVYRGQALVTRVVEVPGPARLTELVVTELPDQIDPGSLFAESTDGIEVRSTRYRTRPVSQDVREEVKTLDAKLREAREKLQAIEKNLAHVEEKRQYLTKLEQFVAPTANAELTRGVLNAETLEKLTTFIFTKRQALIDEELDLNHRQRDVHEEIELLERQRNEIANSSSRTVREAVVFVNVTAENGGELRLRYLVNNATWAPSYNVRANGDRTHALVEYHASIQQRSGEDWNDVKMTLSTATPSLIAKAPTLSPMTISLTHGATQPQQTASAKGKGAVIQNQMQVISNNRLMNNPNVLSEEQQREFRANLDTNGRWYASNNAGALSNYVFDLELNDLAGQWQDFEISNTYGAIQSARKQSVEQGVSVTYQLSSRTTLPSRNDQQLVQVASREMPATFYKVAIPVLTPHVYDEASITNEGSDVLLAGPVSAYIDGKFVGNCSLPTVSIGEAFTVGFGIDSSLRATRELVKRKETTQGGNRVVDFEYQLSVSNFGSEPAMVRVLDRLPQASQSQVKLTLTSTGEDLSEDASYLKKDRKDGILRWEVEVPAGATGVDAWSLNYDFTLEYDRQLTISGMVVTQR